MEEEKRVRESLARFYEALNRMLHGDPSLMGEVWLHDEQVATVHPMGEWVHGWEHIWASWEELAKAELRGSVVPRDTRVSIRGSVAHVTGIEDVIIYIGGRELKWSANVTNLFQLDGAVWKVVLHHSDKAPQAEQAIDDTTMA